MGGGGECFVLALLLARKWIRSALLLHSEKYLQASKFTLNSLMSLN